MVIEEIEIGAFRGIRDAVRLRLGARLTVIHAPNGTGKTSICDATEWLLTGEVARLHKVLKKSPTEGVKNIFTEAEPRTEAAIRSATGLIRFRRVGVGETTRIEEVQNGAWQEISRDDLLNQFTPASFPKVRMRELHVSRSAWLRAVRFLASPSLDLLLDSDKDAQEVRGLMFSQLFGVEELHERETHLRKIARELPSAAQLKKDRTAARKEIRDLEAAAVAVTPEDTASFTPFLEKLNAAAELLEIPTRSSAAETTQFLATVEGRAAEVAEQLAQRRNVFEEIVRGRPRYEQLLVARPESEKAIRTLSEQIAALEIEVGKLKEAQSGTVGSALTNERQVELLAQAGFDSIQPQLLSAIAEWRTADGMVDTTLSIDSLRQTVRDVLRSEAREKAAVEKLQGCLGVWSTWQNAAAQLADVQRRRSALDVPTVEAIRALSQTIQEKRAALVAFDVQTTEISGPLDRMRALANELLERFSSEHLCPLCAHDHSTPEALKAEIERHAGDLPGLLVSRGNQRRQMVEQLAELERQLHGVTQRSNEAIQLQQTADRCAALLRDARDQLRAAGTNEESFDDAGRARLEQSLITRRETVTAAEALSAKQGRLLSAAEALVALGGQIELAIAKVDSLLPELREVRPLAEVVVSEWVPQLQNWNSQIEKKRAELRNAAAAQRSLASEQTTVLSQVTERLNAARREQQERTDAFGKLDADIKNFETLWRKLAGEAIWTIEGQAALSVTQVNAAERLDAVNVALIAARAAHAAVVKSQEAERVAAERRRKIGERQFEILKLEELLSAHTDLAEGASRLKATREAFVLQQVQPLNAVIEAIYLRAQGNRLIDSIKLERKGDVLSWLATASETQFEDIVQLSQGQRQDLALAMFLARARGLGGTFFLDEPLAHLDDLNRVAILDVLRVLAVEQSANPIRLVLTTASSSMVRHLREKFALVPPDGETPALRVYLLRGDPRNGVSVVDDN